MAEFELLEELSPVEKREFIAACTPRRFRRRDIVCHEGDPGDCVHLILSGRYVVRITTPLGNSATLTILGPGEMFGEQALLSPEARRTATIVAVTDGETLTLNRTQLERLRREHPQVERFLTTSLAAQVQPALRGGAGGAVPAGGDAGAAAARASGRCVRGRGR